MSRIASGCLGMKTILVAMSTPLGFGRGLRQWNGRRHADLVAEHARGVPLARRVLDEPSITGTEHVLRAVAQADLELARENDHELTAGGRMPVQELAGRPFSERDLARGQTFQPVGLRLEIDLLDVRLLIGARVQPECPHHVLLVRSIDKLDEIGMLAQIGLATPLRRRKIPPSSGWRARTSSTAKN